MRIQNVVAVAGVTIAMAGTTAVGAQTGAVHVGPRVTYNFDFEKTAIGFQAGFPIANRIDFAPSVDIFFPDNGSLLALNADLKLRPLPADAAMLYIGTGLNLTRAAVRSASNTEAGLNLIAGLEGRAGAVHPFAEVRTILADRTSVQLTAGLNFTLRGR